MLTEKQLQQLKSENEYLQLQLEDVNSAIRQKEEELELLRETAGMAAELKSKLDSNLVEISSLQENMAYRDEHGTYSEVRMEELEKELFDSIKDQQKCNDAFKDNQQLQANLLDTTNELKEASSIYIKLQRVKASLSETQSNLEIANLEIESLKAELKEVKWYNEQLLSKKDKGK
ncbi:MAG TPA: hypothetical protein VK498_08420 [Ferruginibacter sp.]|nr:hypothetical protein [Ferruginibacter sp.]